MAAALNCNLEIQDDRNRILAAISHHTQTGKGRKEGRKAERGGGGKVPDAASVNDVYKTILHFPKK